LDSRRTGFFISFRLVCWCLGRAFLSRRSHLESPCVRMQHAHWRLWQFIFHVSAVFWPFLCFSSSSKLIRLAQAGWYHSILRPGSIRSGRFYDIFPLSIVLSRMEPSVPLFRLLFAICSVLLCESFLCSRSVLSCSVDISAAVPHAARHALLFVPDQSPFVK